MTEFELAVLEKLDLIIAQTAPKKKKLTAPVGEDGRKVLALFNRYFKKNQSMTASNEKHIKARLKDKFTVDQIESWFKYVTTDKWWSTRPLTHKISTLLGDKLGERLEQIGVKREGQVDTVTDAMMGI